MTSANVNDVRLTSRHAGARNVFVNGCVQFEIVSHWTRQLHGDMDDRYPELRTCGHCVLCSKDRNKMFRDPRGYGKKSHGIPAVKKRRTLHFCIFSSKKECVSNFFHISYDNVKVEHQLYSYQRYIFIKCTCKLIFLHSGVGLGVETIFAGWWGWLQFMFPMQLRWTIHSSL